MGIIEFKDVSFQYPNGFSAVENVSFDNNCKNGKWIIKANAWNGFD